LTACHGEGAGRDQDHFATIGAFKRLKGAEIPSRGGGLDRFGLNPAFLGFFHHPSRFYSLNTDAYNHKNERGKGDGRTDNDYSFGHLLYHCIPSFMAYLHSWHTFIHGIPSFMGYLRSWDTFVHVLQGLPLSMNKNFAFRLLQLAKKIESIYNVTTKNARVKPCEPVYGEDITINLTKLRPGDTFIEYFDQIKHC
jgi:hypothetical protein